MSSFFYQLLWGFPMTHWKRPWCWERLRARGEGGNRGWDGWMASPIQWKWTWANLGRWWGIGRPGVMQSMGLQSQTLTEWLSNNGSAVENLPPVQETQVQSLGWENSLEEETTTHSSILAWKVPWTEESEGLQSMGSQGVGHNWVLGFLPLSSLAPIPKLGGCWPPTGIFLLNPSEVLLLNSCVLLASRVSITWAHHSFMERNWKHILETPFITIASCLCLTLLQASEYYETSFTISDGLSGSTFFVATGFRGLHVILGSTSLIVWFFTSIKIPFHIQPPLWLRSCCLSFDPRISSSSFLYKIIFSSHYISFLWFRNCTPLSTPLSIMNVI